MTKQVKKAVQKAPKIIAKSAKKLKNSREVASVFKDAQSGVIDYKGGYAVVIAGRVKEIFVGSDAFTNAVRRMKLLI